jgi:hypothetical protein
MGGRRFLPKATTRKRREVQFKTFKNLNMPKITGDTFSTMPSHANLYFNFQEFKWPSRHSQLSSKALLSRFNAEGEPTPLQ